MSDYITTLDQTSNILWNNPSATEDITLNHLQVSKLFSFVSTIDIPKRYVDGIGMAVKYTYKLKRPEMDTLYSFWQDRKGSYDKFYIPIFENYFELAQDVHSGDTLIYIKIVPYLENWLTGQYIWFDMKNGDRIVRKVTAITKESAYEVVTLDSGLPYDFTQADIGFFGRFVLTHFNDDAFDIEYVLKDFMEVTCIFHQIVAVDTEDPALYAELYEITIPSGTTYYTSYYKDIEYNNNVYLASLMKRGGIQYSLDINDNNTLSLTIYPTNYVKENIFTQPLAQVGIVIKRINLIDNSISQIYTGHVTGISFSGDLAVLNLESKDKALDFNVPTVVYQSTCNNDLYDKHCKVASANYSVIANITAVSGNDITAAEIGTKPDGYFTIGYAKYSGEYRMITAHTGDTITLLRPFSTDVTGKAVIVYAGCDKSAATCKNKFNNIQNFRGFAYIPSKNPSFWGLK